MEIFLVCYSRLNVKGNKVICAFDTEEKAKEKCKELKGNSRKLYNYFYLKTELY